MLFSNSDIRDSPAEEDRLAKEKSAGGSTLRVRDFDQSTPLRTRHPAQPLNRGRWSANSQLLGIRQRLPSNGDGARGSPRIGKMANSKAV
jgi:hypothetical protein